MKYILLFFTILLADAAHAISIRDALTAAYKNNQDLLAARQGVLATHEGIVQAKKGYRPTIQAQGTQGVSVSRQKSDANSISQNTLQQNKSGTVQVNQNLFKGGADAATVAKTEFDIKSQWAQLKNAEQQIMQKVIQAYLDLYVKYASVEVYKANLVAAHKSYEAAHDKKQIGEETLTNEAAAEAQYAQAQAKLEQAKAAFETAQATFEQLTNLKAPEKVDKPNEILETPKSLQELQEVALAYSPKIEQSKHDYDSEKSNKKIATGQLLPSIDLSASSSRQAISPKTKIKGYTVQNQTQTTVNNQAGLTITIPLYEQGNIRSQRRQAKDKIVQKRITMESIRREIIQACQQSYLSYIATKANLKNNEIQEKAQSIAVDSAQQEVEVGTKVLTDLLTQQTNLLNAKLSSIQNIQDYYQAMYQMLALQGKLTGEALKLDVEYFKPEDDYNQVKNRF